MNYQPTPRQILAHNFCQAWATGELRLDIIAAEPTTARFGAHLLSTLADYLGIVISADDDAAKILSNDMFDTFHACEAYAYSYIPGSADESTTVESPYSHYSPASLRSLLAQSPYTIWHFGVINQHLFSSPIPQLGRLNSAILAYFTARYSTAVWAITSFPLSGNENPAFINREEYFLNLISNASEVVM